MSESEDSVYSSHSSHSSHSSNSVNSVEPQTTSSPDVVIDIPDANDGNNGNSGDNEDSERKDLDSVTERHEEPIKVASVKITPIVEQDDEFNQPKLKSKEEQKADRVKILKRLDELRRRKRENEYFIRVAQQTIKYRAQELQRQVKRHYNQIRRIRYKTGRSMEEFDDLLAPIPYETVGMTAMPIIDPIIDPINDPVDISFFPPSGPQFGLASAKLKVGEEEDFNPDNHIEMSEDITETEVEEIRFKIDELKERAYREIEDLRFEIEEKNIENAEIGRLMKNNWDPQNVSTVTKWIKEGDKQSFIYDRVRDKLQQKVKFLTVIIMIVSGIQSMFSMSRFGFSEEDYPTITLVFNIVTAVMSTLIFMITTYIKDSKFEDVIQSLTSYVGKIDHFLSSMVSIADIKPELRPDGDSFVTENRETYAEIYREAPNISKSQMESGIQDYKKYVINADPEKETHCSRKRTNYAYFARQVVQEADVHSIWGKIKDSDHHYHVPNRGNSYGGTYGTFARNQTESEDRKHRIDRPLRSVRPDTTNDKGDSRGPTESTDEDDQMIIRTNQ